MRSKNAREKKIKYLWDMEEYEYSTEAEARARTGRKPVGLKTIDTNKGSAEAPRYRSRLVCTEVRHEGVEPIFSARPPLEGRRVSSFELGPFPDFHCRCESSTPLRRCSSRRLRSDCQTRIPRQSCQGVCGKLKDEDDRRLLNVGENTMLRCWRREGCVPRRGFSVPL